MANATEHMMREARDGGYYNPGDDAITLAHDVANPGFTMNVRTTTGGPGVAVPGGLMSIAERPTGRSAEIAPPALLKLFD